MTATIATAATTKIPRRASQGCRQPLRPERVKVERNRPPTPAFCCEDLPVFAPPVRRAGDFAVLFPDFVEEEDRLEVEDLRVLHPVFVFDIFPPSTI